MYRYHIEMDLCRDYSRLVRYWLGCRGIKSEKNGADLWYGYFNLQKKTIPSMKRKVFISKEFQCPSYLEKQLLLLIDRIENGNDITPHLSKSALSPSKFDDLLYDWGIYHLHLGKNIEVHTGFVQRTGPVLFARFDNEFAYLINVYSHGKGAPSPPWSKQEMMQIVYNNWPHTIEKFRLPEVTKVYPESARHPTDYERSLARKASLTTLLEIEENAVYFHPGGGFMSSGHSAEIIRLCDHIHNTLKLNEIHIKERIHTFIQMIEKQSGITLSSPIRFMLWHEGEKLFVIEPSTCTAIIEIVF